MELRHCSLVLKRKACGPRNGVSSLARRGNVAKRDTSVSVVNGIFHDSGGTILQIP